MSPLTFQVKNKARKGTQKLQFKEAFYAHTHGFRKKVDVLWSAPHEKPTDSGRNQHPTVVLRRNYQKKNDERKISSESVRVLIRPSEKPWFSLIELAIFEKMDFELYLMKPVTRILRFAVFLVFPKNGSLRRLLGICSCYYQLFFYISATLCAIFMTLAPKLWRPQWFEVG